MARGCAAHSMNHRIALLQRIAAHHGELGLMRLGELFAFRLERGGAQVLGWHIDEIAYQTFGVRFGGDRVDRADLRGQQHPRALCHVLASVAIEAVLPGDPAEHRRARLTGGEAIGALGQVLGELGEAPARQAFGVGHAADRKPAVALGHNPDLVAAALELLRRKSRALACGKPLGEGFETVLVHKMDGNRVSAAVGLDKGFGFAHVCSIIASGRLSPADSDR